MYSVNSKLYKSNKMETSWLRVDSSYFVVQLFLCSCHTVRHESKLGRSGPF